MRRHGRVKLGYDNNPIQAYCAVIDGYFARILS